jgi:CubicO group peptidase (beta-lactamase class C family)
MLSMSARYGIRIDGSNLPRARALIALACIAFAVLAVSLWQTRGVQEGVPLGQFTDHLNERIPNLMDHFGIPGSVIAVVRRGEPVWSEAYGFADVKGARPMTTNTPCRVESISKSVTAWGVMRLVEQGKIRLDDPVELHLGDWPLPESSFPSEQVTVQRLLSHTAGMPLGDIFERYSPGEDIPTLSESLADKAVVEREPGSTFLYSNTGFDLLELMIEKVTGRDFAEYMRDEVLLPLGMDHSHFVWSESYDPPVANGHDQKGQPIPVYVYPATASGGLFSTVDDIARFVAAGMTRFGDAGRAVLHSESIAELHAPVVDITSFYGIVFDAYGYGHFVENLSNGYRAVAHGGHGYGWMTHFHAVPETGDGIVILTNSQRSWPFFAYVLNDWAHWIGAGSVGMGKIIFARRVLLALVSLIAIMSLWRLLRIVQGLVSGRRRFAPLARNARAFRLVHGALSIVLFLGVLWCVSRDYLLLTSIFPVVSGWLWLALSVCALALFLSSVAPEL